MPTRQNSQFWMSATSRTFIVRGVPGRLYVRAARVSRPHWRNARGTNTPCIGTTVSAMPSLNSGKGLNVALLVARCQGQTSGGSALTSSRATRFQLLRDHREETDGHLRDLRARHPAIAGGSVHHVHAVSSRVTPSPPSRPPGRIEPGCYYISYYSARHAKGPLPTGKGP